MKAFCPCVAVFCVAFGTLALAAGSTTVAGQPPGSAGVSSGRKVVPQRQDGNVDLTDSRVYIFVGKTGLGHDHGVEGRLKAGAIRLGATQHAGVFVFDMTSFDADTPAARRYVGLEANTDASTREKVNANMRGSAVLDVEQFPEARFEIESAKPLTQLSKQGNPLYEILGQFTLHGVTQPLRFRAEAISDKSGNRLRTGFVIRQSQFGIKPFTKAFGAVGVADELRIYGDIVLTQNAEVATSGADQKGVQR